MITSAPVAIPQCRSFLGDLLVGDVIEIVFFFSYLVRISQRYTQQPLGRRQRCPACAERSVPVAVGPRVSRISGPWRAHRSVLLAPLRTHRRSRSGATAPAAAFSHDRAHTSGWGLRPDALDGSSAVCRVAARESPTIPERRFARSG
jgi:hypothetical protein